MNLSDAILTAITILSAFALIHFCFQQRKHDGISKYFVWNMLQDKNGNIWIGTRNTGLYKFDGTSFTNYSE